MQNLRWSRSVYVALIFTIFFISCSPENGEATPMRDQESRKVKGNPGVKVVFSAVGMNERFAYALVTLYSLIRHDANNPDL